MRRPSPLPQTPARDDAGRGAASEDEAIAPVLTLPAGRPVLPTAPEREASPDASASGATPRADDPSRGDDDTPPRDVRLRDVWKAARASRRALRAEVRRFTVRQRRRRLAWIVGLAAVVLVAVGAVGVAYSPLFAVERVRVVGTAQLDAASVETALAGQLGTPLARVDESAVKAALVGFPLVETYTLEARPPHELVVRIVERTPVGLVETPAGFALVDAAGVVLSTTPDPVPGHPVVTVTGGTTSPAFAAVGRVMRTLPDGIRSQVTAVAATTPDDVTLTLGGTGTQIVWGSADRSADKAVALERMMVQRPPDSVSSYDVSSPSAIVVR